MSGGLLTRGEETRYYLIKKNNPTTVQSTPARTEGDTRRPTVSIFFLGGGGDSRCLCGCAPSSTSGGGGGGGGVCVAAPSPMFFRVIRMCYINGLIMNLLPGMFSSGSARLTQNSHHFLFYEYISILHGMLKGKENAEQMYA